MFQGVFARVCLVHQRPASHGSKKVDCDFISPFLLNAEIISLELYTGHMRYATRRTASAGLGACLEVRRTSAEAIARYTYLPRVMASPAADEM